MKKRSMGDRIFDAIRICYFGCCIFDCIFPINVCGFYFLCISTGTGIE